jgi:hypothetical protein
MVLMGFMFFGVELRLIGGFFGRKWGFELSGSSGDGFLLGFVGLFMLIDMCIKIVDDFFKLF